MESTEKKEQTFKEYMQKYAEQHGLSRDSILEDAENFFWEHIDDGATKYAMETGSPYYCEDRGAEAHTLAQAYISEG